MSASERQRAAMAEYAANMAARVRNGTTTEISADMGIRIQSEQLAKSAAAAWPLYDHGIEVFRRELRNPERKES